MIHFLYDNKLIRYHQSKQSNKAAAGSAKEKVVIGCQDSASTRFLRYCINACYHTHSPKAAKNRLIRFKNSECGPAVALCHFQNEVKVAKLPAHQDPNKNCAYQATSIR
jgi:hypothetical protein